MKLLKYLSREDVYMPIIFIICFICMNIWFSRPFSIVLSPRTLIVSCITSLKFTLYTSIGILIVKICLVLIKKLSRQ